MYTIEKIVAILIVPVMFALCAANFHDDFQRFFYTMFTVISGIAAMGAIGYIVTR